ncbi:MAG: sigma factor-like helix-turn-helix DNA-binding protein, partial [Planctomycetota bacterium]
PEAAPPAAPAQPDVPTQQEEAARATAALERLRPEQQRVLQLSIYHGRSHEEIARSTGLPLGTVKTHARRGLIRLREILEADGALERNLPPKGSDGAGPGRQAGGQSRQ